MWVPIWLWWVVIVFGAAMAVWNTLLWQRYEEAKDTSEYFFRKWTRLGEYIDELWDILCDPEAPRELLEEKMRKLP